jgi:TPR repeat protein
MGKASDILEIGKESDKIFDIGVFLEEEEMIDYSKIVYAVSAILGNSMAMTRLADLLWVPEKIDDFDSARYLYLKAGRLGDPVGFHNLSLLYKAIGDEASFGKYMKMANESGLPSGLEEDG